MTSVTDARGHTLVNVYDGLGRRVELRSGTAAGTLRASWSYDTLAKGQVTSATRHEGSAQYVSAVTGYDEGYRPLGQSVSIPASEGALAGTYTTSFTYLANGQLESVRLPAAGGLGAETVTTNYDGLSLPEWMGGGLGWGVYVANTLYSAYGDPVQSEYGNSYSVFVDNFFETGTRRLTGSSVLVEGDEHPITDVTYTYDDAGNPLSIVDDPVSGVGDAQCFAYDGLRRLTQAWTPAGGDCSVGPSVAGLGGAAPYWFTDAFDVVGNRTSRVVHAAAGDTTTTYAYAPGTHQVTGAASSGPGGATSSSFAYDDAGNTTTRDVAGDPTQALTWDAEGELTQVTDGSATDSYVYTADGDRLVRRQGGATTVYLPGGMELTLAGGTVTATRYYAFNGQVVAVRTGPGTAGVSTLVADHHGTAGLSIDNTTRVVTRRYTDPYGAPRGTAPASWAGDHGFLDKPVDTTGLVAIGARYYDPALGRFISVDPVMDLADPQQWHGYAYANNNPITYTDPTGLITRVDDEGQKGYRGAGAKWRKKPYTPGYTPVPPKSVAPPVCTTEERDWGAAIDVGRAAGDGGIAFVGEASGNGMTSGLTVNEGIDPNRIYVDGQPTSLRLENPIDRWNRSLLANNGFVRLGKTIQALDIAMIGVDGFDNYVNRYGDVEDTATRIELTVGRTATTGTAGVAAGGVVLIVGLLVLCPFTAGGTCGAAAVVGSTLAAGAAGYYVEREAGEAFDRLVAPIMEPSLAPPTVTGHDECFMPAGC